MAKSSENGARLVARVLNESRAQWTVEDKRTRPGTFKLRVVYVYRP